MIPPIKAATGVIYDRAKRMSKSSRIYIIVGLQIYYDQCKKDVLKPVDHARKVSARR